MGELLLTGAMAGEISDHKPSARTSPEVDRHNLTTVKFTTGLLPAADHPYLTGIEAAGVPARTPPQARLQT